MNVRGIDDGIVRECLSVGNIVVASPAQAAAKQRVGAYSIRPEPITRAARHGIGLVVIEVYVVARYVREAIRIKQRLTGNDVGALRLLVGEVCVPAPLLIRVGRRQLKALRIATV